MKVHHLINISKLKLKRLHPIFFLYYMLLRRTILSCGLFDQLRVDNGKEFSLSLAIQERMSDRRQNQAIRCYQQTESKRVRFEHSYYVNLFAKP